MYRGDFVARYNNLVIFFYFISYFLDFVICYSNSDIF
jgi:hypothetical protein